MQVTVSNRVPFVDQRVLRRYRVHEISDSRFRAAARFRQALYRQNRGWRAGQIVSTDGSRRTVGNYIKPSDAAAGANFLSPEIAALARREVAYREDLALIDRERLFSNLLSSQPLVFNLVGPLKLNPRLATKVAKRLWPDLVHRVIDVLFEHSPGRRNPNFTHDRTAFDVVLRCQDRLGKDTFIAFEIKYSESMLEPVARLRPRYDALSEQSGLYTDPQSLDLRTAPLQSLWRQHLLAASMVHNKLYESGRFVLVAPVANSPVHQAAAAYHRHLREDVAVPFETISLETMIAAIGSLGGARIAQRLFDRYANFSDLDRFI